MSKVLLSFFIFTWLFFASSFLFFSSVSANAQLVPGADEICAEGECPNVGEFEEDTLNSSSDSVVGILIGAIRFILFIINALAILLLVPLTIIGIVLLVKKPEAGKKKKYFWPIFMIAVCPVVLILSIITFVVLGVFSQILIAGV